MSVPITDLIEPTEGLESFGRGAINIWTQHMNQRIVGPASPFPLVDDVLLGAIGGDVLEHEKVFVHHVQLLDVVLVLELHLGVAAEELEEALVGIVQEAG